MKEEATKPLFSIRPSGVAKPDAAYLPEIHRLWTWLRAGTDANSHEWFGIIPHYGPLAPLHARFEQAYPEIASHTRSWAADTEIECWSIDSEFRHGHNEKNGNGLGIYVLGRNIFPQHAGCVSVARSLDAYYLSHLLTLNKPCHRAFLAFYPPSVTKAVIPRDSKRGEVGRPTTNRHPSCQR